MKTRIFVRNRRLFYELNAASCIRSETVLTFHAELVETKCSKKMVFELALKYKRWKII